MCFCFFGRTIPLIWQGPALLFVSKTAAGDSFKPLFEQEGPARGHLTKLRMQHRNIHNRCINTGTKKPARRTYTPRR